MVLKYKSTCYVCKAPASVSEATSNNFVEMVTQKLYIHCRHQDKGCEAVVPLAKLESHEEKCTHLELLELRQEVADLKAKLADRRPNPRKKFGKPVKHQQLTEDVNFIDFCFVH